MAALRLGMYLPELKLPFERALAAARELGVEYVWFNRVPDEPAIEAMTDAEIDRLAARVDDYGLRMMVVQAGNPFKEVHLIELDPERPHEHPQFRRDFGALTRSMQIAARLGIGAVGAFTFAWPGEYSAGKPTWPMRWLTRGGVISEPEMALLVRVFSLVLEEAERYGVDVALSMMPWNYTSSTTNFRRLAEALGSRRIRAIWGPADNLNSGEADVATAGFLNIRPYLFAVHVKDLRVTDGLRNRFEYCPVGTGDVDYPTILSNLRRQGTDVVLSVSTHFLPPSGRAEEAMRTNVENLRALVERASADGTRSAAGSGR